MLGRVSTLKRAASVPSPEEISPRSRSSVSGTAWGDKKVECGKNHRTLQSSRVDAAILASPTEIAIEFLCNQQDSWIIDASRGGTSRGLPDYCSKYMIAGLGEQHCGGLQLCIYNTTNRSHWRRSRAVVAATQTLRYKRPSLNFIGLITASGRDKICLTTTLTWIFYERVLRPSRTISRWSRMY